MARFLIVAVAVCLLAAAPTTAARTMLEASPAGEYQQCGGTGGSCAGAQCKDAAVAKCPAGNKCFRISQYYWMCDTQQPKPTPAPPTPAGAYKQCGGTGDGCTGSKCRDGVWPGQKCPSGFACYRVSQYYWQCDTHPLTPTPASPLPAGAYKQCGGAGNGCKGSKCKDAVWPGAKCPSKFSCERVNKWYWQCDTHKLD